MISARSIAVAGFGFGMLAITTEGFWFVPSDAVFVPDVSFPEGRVFDVLHSRGENIPFEDHEHVSLEKRNASILLEGMKAGATGLESPVASGAGSSSKASSASPNVGRSGAKDLGRVASTSSASVPGRSRKA